MIIKPETQPSEELPSAEEDASDLTEVVEVQTVRRVSGRYEAPAEEKASFQTVGRAPDATRISSLAQAANAGREELRLDVDGTFPQQTASGVAVFGLQRVHWIASLTPDGDHAWKGPIFYVDGPTGAFPYTAVQVNAYPGVSVYQHRAEVRFEAPGGLSRVRWFDYKSRYFHKVDFEFDAAEGEAPTTWIDTAAHPNHPAGLPAERLTMRKVFGRAGFFVSQSPGGTVPISGAGANARWSDNEMHDAMQVFWSRFSATSRWAMWVFFASLHEQGTSLGGIMFDDIGANHRQGTAIFNDAFISKPPADDPNPDAWVQRMVFWTACHEMGHAFNLAHSWQKSLGTPWVPGLANEPEVRSFMNYPFRVAGGESKFFADFEYRFSDAELLFLRHAPERLVQMGNAAWFDHHGFQEARVSPRPTLRLDLRVNRDDAIFEYLELVTLELKLTNDSADPQIVDANILRGVESMTVVIKAKGRPAREFTPFGRYCYLPDNVVLYPGESIYAPLAVSAGLNGWDISDPGRYLVQVALHRDDEDLVSNELFLRVAPPRSYEEELIAQDVFTQDVGRVLAVRGSEVLAGANDVLRAVVDQLGDRRIAIHAAVALAAPEAKEYKVLTPTPDTPAGLAVQTRAAKPDEARRLLDEALVSRRQDAAETLGHIGYLREADATSEFLAEAGDPAAAAETQSAAYETLSNRTVRDRKVLTSILDAVARKRDEYEEMAKPARSSSASAKSTGAKSSRSRSTKSKSTRSKSTR
jgi:hypothetical protein